MTLSMPTGEDADTPSSLDSCYGPYGAVSRALRGHQNVMIQREGRARPLDLEGSLPEGPLGSKLREKKRKRTTSPREVNDIGPGFGGRRPNRFHSM